MKVVVLNGSPKGNNSISLQTVLFIEKHFKKCRFEYFNVGQKIKMLEKNTEKLSEIFSAMKKADLILFVYPVYTFLVPSQLHRFIELVKEEGLDLSGKYVSQITTSKHFYDVTAHNFIKENCQDLEMRYMKGLSADMEDLLSKKGQKDALSFFKYLIFNMNHGFFEELPEKKIRKVSNKEVLIPENTDKDTSVKPVVIVADIGDEDDRLADMVDRFRAVLDIPSRVVNIREYPFGGGCISCFNCSQTGKCIYKDGFDDFLRNNIQAGSAIVYAFSVKDHSMGSLFKMYDDRQFCNGRRTVTMGAPTGYMISGSLRDEENLRMVIEARADVGGNFLTEMATDEIDPNAAVDKLAVKLSYAIKEKYRQPQAFYGVGGMKIFRDLIYLMQGMMRADHKFFKEHGQYDFPQKKKGQIAAMYLVGGMMANQKIKAKMGSKMNEGMLAPYKKVLD